MNDQNIFTEDEKTILKSLPENYKWIARDKNGFIYVYANKPHKITDIAMFEVDPLCRDFYLFKHMFKGVTWENSPICFRKPNLDDVERRYLKGVFRPFKDKKILVKKTINYKDEEYLTVTKYDVGVRYEFPPFDAGDMYKGMELNKYYTLEELGITYEQ